MIYMDNAASTEVSENVKKVLLNTLDKFGNPSSIHKYGEDAARIIMKTSDIIAESINCSPDEIYYTNGATMGNSVFIQGFLREHKNAKFITSTIEHNDIMDLAKYLKDIGIKVYYVTVDKKGQLNTVYLEKLLNTLDGHTAICSFQWANSECGVIQDMKKISDIIHSHKNMYLHTDATQYFPYYRINIQRTKIDALTMSGQKINCIKGTGFLYLSKLINIKPVIFGEQGIIGGTENVLGIACLGEAIKSINYKIGPMTATRDIFIEKLGKENIIGDLINRTPNNIYTKCKKDGESMVVFLNEFGILASAGSACSSISKDPSHVMMAMGYDEKTANNCVRFTISRKTTLKEVDYVVDVFNNLNSI